MKKLIFYGSIIALADPSLLFFIWRYWGLDIPLAIVILSPIIGGALLAWAKRRSVSSPEQMLLGGMLGDQIFFTAARFLFIYPGPLSTLLALLLLIPAVRRTLQTWAMNRMMRAISNGSLSIMSGTGGNPFAGMGGFPGAEPPQPGPRGPLKRTDGRVVDGNDPKLSAPEDQD